MPNATTSTGTTQTRTFVFEIGSEEMPSAPLEKAIVQFKSIMEKKLDAASLSYASVRIFSTPRRLTALVSELAEATEAVHLEQRGPKAAIAFDGDNNPTKAAEGFARRFGLTAKDLERRVAEDGNEYVFALQEIAAKQATELLPDLCEAAIAEISWPRSQRWGCEQSRYVRPIRWMCALFGDEVISFHYADVTSGRLTSGHRVLSPGMHEVPTADAYETTLQTLGVLDKKTRLNTIQQAISELEAKLGNVCVDQPLAVLSEVVNLCECPRVLLGHFDEEFLQVPHEIICDSMLSHQRYFPIYTAAGELTNQFVIVSNTAAENDMRVIDGNERVVRARLDDAKFFYEEDLKQPLEAYLERLKKVVFQEKLGTVYQKALRMQALAERAAIALGENEQGQTLAKRAAYLAKADLATQAVVEFTSQQGIMGFYYAEAAGEDPEVALAIKEHYRPRFAGDNVPSTAVGTAVALADKLDTIVGMFAIKQPPTGSSDPFAQRRSALGIIAMLEPISHVGLSSLIACVLELYRAQGLEFDWNSTAEAIKQFFLGRLAQLARQRGASAETVEAIVQIGVVDPKEFFARVLGLQHVQQDEPELFNDLASAYTRVAHLADTTLGSDPDPSLFSELEKSLYDACEQARSHIDKSLMTDDFEGACHALGALKTPIDRFLDDVLVMDKDTVVRENRLRLLNRFVEVFKGVANIGVLSRVS